MSFLCCCCVRSKPADQTAQAGADDDIEIPRGGSSSSQENNSPQLNFDGPTNRKPRNACVLASGRIRWGNRSTSQASSGLQDDDSSEDSYDEEFVHQARGSPGKRPTLYVPYLDGNEPKAPPTGNTREKGIYLRSLALRQERASFQEGRETFLASVVSRVNEVRVQHSSKPLKTSPELHQLAEQLWKDRARVHDGFAVVPRCVYFSRALRDRRVGCLTYYTPRSARIDAIPQAMVHFWQHSGVARKSSISGEQGSSANFRTNSPEDFPSAKAGESYLPDATSAMRPAFERYRKHFPQQLLAAQCKFIGLHADMVQLAKDSSCNVVCVAVVFDYVANRKARAMDSPIE